MEQEQVQNTAPSRAAVKRQQAQKQRTRHGMLLAYMLLAVVVLFTAITLLSRDRWFSENENRILTQAPKLSLSSLTDGSFAAQAEDHFADQFAGRDFWMSADLARSRFFGAKENNGVYLCKDNYLIQAPDDPDSASLARNLAAINDFAARHSDLKICMTTVPNAACILADKLPSGAPVRDQRSDIAAIRDALQGVSFLDVTDTLAAHSGEYLYYRTDHHWTSLGAYYGLTAMADGLGLPELCDYAVYTVSRSFVGTLASKSGSTGICDTITVYDPQSDVEYNVSYYADGSPSTVATLYDRDALNTKDQYTVFFGGNYPRIDVRTTAETGRSLLLFKDSYANCFVQLLTPYYEKIILVDPRYYYDDIEALIRSEGVTDVLFLYNLDTFQGDKSLANTLEIDTPETD